MRGKIRSSELTNALGIAGTTFHRWRRAGYLPKPSYHRGRAMFDAGEVLDAIDEHFLQVTPAGFARLQTLKEQANAPK